jgi:hypothetical protein
LTTLTFLLSVSTAHAKPAFGLTESSARAGDLVHFTISGVDGGVTYALEVDDTEVVEGTGDGGVSGTFTVPDLGDAVRTVTVDAKIRGSGRRKSLQSELEYLGSALPLTGPLPAPPPAVPVVSQEVPPSEPSYSPDAIERTSPAPAVTRRSSHRRRESRKRHAIEPARHVARSGERRRRAHRRRDRRHHGAAARKTRSKRAAEPATPLSDGVPVPGGPAQRPGAEPLAPSPALVAMGARAGDAGGTAVMVPALLGLGALALAGTAVLRRRRLVSRRGRD